MRQPASQWVNCLALFLGGLGLFIPQFSPYLAHVLLNFLIFGAILGFFWPERGWQWGLWLAIPALTLSLANMAIISGLGDIAGTMITIGYPLIAGALMGWLGSKYSPRRLPFRGLR